jgi:hypothetical protein
MCVPYNPIKLHKIDHYNSAKRIPICHDYDISIDPDIEKQVSPQLMEDMLEHELVH